MAASATTATSPPASNSVAARDENDDGEQPCLLHRSLRETPQLVASATGSYLVLPDGRRILDACGGAAVAVLGHGNEEVAAAVAAQMRQVSYVHTMAFGTSSSEDLARCVLGRGPRGSVGRPASPRDEPGHGLVKAYFIGSGSEANDAAMKCARQYWVEQGEPQRRFFVARRQAYHGNTLGAMSISNMPVRKAPFADILLPGVSFVGPADAFHGRRRGDSGETEEAFTARLIAELDAEFLRLGPENVISFIGETVSGAALGSMPAPPGYWRGVRALCDKYGILLHLDEVMCGSGRVGTYFAFEQEDIRPDLVTLGKGLGGGYAPIASMLVNDRIVQGLRRGTSAFNHGHTYQAHPVSCAAALAVQTVLKRERLVQRVATVGPALGALLREAFADCPHAGDIRGRGFFWSVEFLQDKPSQRPFPTDICFGHRVQKAALERGVAVYPGSGTVDGVQGDHVTLAPPFTASMPELKTSVETLRAAYDDVVAHVERRGPL